MTLGNHTGTSGLNPRISLNKTVTSEKTNTTQAIKEPKKVSRMRALARKMDGIDKKISQSENWLYNNRKRSLAPEMPFYRPVFLLKSNFGYSLAPLE